MPDRPNHIPAKKSLGQNFLVDPGIARRIVRSVGLTPADVVLEIGPGEGALTQHLLAAAGQVVAVELDPRCAELLEQKFCSPNSPAAKFHLSRADILQTDLTALLAQAQVPAHQRVRVVANLPYYISSPVIEHLLQARARLRDLTLMLQREVVDRLASPPDSKDYGSLSVFVQYYCQIEKLFNVSPQVFRPQPKVMSTVVRLIVRPQPAVEVTDESWFFQLVRAAFAQRRKTLSNNLKVLLGSAPQAAAALRAVAIDPQRRAETLSLAEFARLANYLAIHR